MIVTMKNLPSRYPFVDPPWRQPQAAYLHIPFCAHHCGYCDFAVVTGQDHRVELYLDALEAELSSLVEPHPVRTIFLGGGTPTYLTPRQLTRLLTAVQRWLPWYDPGDSEFSLEATPETLDAARLQVLADFGVQRISIGVQSFAASHLYTLDRQHQVNQIAPAIERVRSWIGDFSLDLIFGVPGQTLLDWRKDLEQALAFAPDHLSTYGLTFEKGTPLWKQVQRGQTQPLDEELERAMYEHVLDRLPEAGFEHYEVSNFARPGKRCRHNEVYWANEAYLGFGLGAARYVQGRRELNTRSLHTYLRRTLSGEPATFQSEQLEPLERAFETVAIQLRRRAGIDRERFKLQTDFELDALLSPKLQQQLELGLLADDGQNVSLTRTGLCVADGVIAALLR